MQHVNAHGTDCTFTTVVHDNTVCDVSVISASVRFKILLASTFLAFASFPGLCHDWNRKSAIRLLICTALQQQLLNPHLEITLLKLCSGLRRNFLPISNLSKKLLDVTLAVLQLSGQNTSMCARLCEGRCLAVLVVMCDSPCYLQAQTCKVGMQSI